jgi:hypothetical protein
VSNEEFDPFKGSSGLADDIDVTFTEVRFGVDPAYTDTETGEPVPVFIADLATDDSDIGTNGVIENQIFSIGKGWVIEDDGASVVVASGKPRGFNTSTYLQRILQRLLELDETKARKRFEETGVGPQSAAYWEGLQVHMVQEERTIQIGKGPSRVKSELMPSEFYGWTDGEVEEKAKPEVKAKPAAKKAAAPKPKPAPKPAPAAEDEPAETPGSEYAAAKAQVDPDLVAKIEAIAADCDDADTFMSRAYSEIEGLDEDDNAMYLVDNVDAEDGIWAVRCAG